MKLSSETMGFIERVRFNTNILEVIGNHVDLGRSNLGVCPFHPDVNPSLSITPEKGLFYCFGCGVGGDVFRFLELIQQRSFLEILMELAEQANIPIPLHLAGDRRQLEHQHQLTGVLDAAVTFYHRLLSEAARTYLTEERGLTQGTIDRFRLGHAVGGLQRHLIDERDFDLDLCIEAGVLKRVDDGGIVEHFRDRIIIPIVSQGRVVQVIGRALGNRNPKYLMLPSEMEWLFNQDVLPSAKVYVTEGVFDCLVADQMGYPAVAILGTSRAKSQHLSELSRCEDVYVCMDADPVGRTASLAIAGTLGNKAKIVVLPDGQDLDEYLTDHSKEEFDHLTASAKDLARHLLDAVPPDTSKVDLPARLDPVLRHLATLDPARQEAYLGHEIKPRFGLTEADIRGYRRRIKELESEVSQPDDAADRDHQVLISANFPGLVDLVDADGKVAFIVRDGTEPAVVSEFSQDGVTFQPPLLGQIPWLLPRASEVERYFQFGRELGAVESNAALFDDLVRYHRSLSELPSDEYYDLLAAWDLLTYVLEDVQYFPIICFYGVAERGKSRTGKGMIYVARNGLHVESLRDAYIIRVASSFGAALFFDVMNLWRKAEKSGSEDVLLHRFEKGAKVPRVLYPDRGAFHDTVYFDIFGPTIFATNQPVHHILETRAISINLPEGKAPFDVAVTPQLGLPLKERLVAFRAQHLGEHLPEVAKPAPGRLGDILRPLLQIIRLVRPARESAFLELVKKLQAERLVERADSLEADILTAITKLKGDVVKGVLGVKAITDTINVERSVNSQLTPQRIGRILSALGFQKAKTGSGASAILWNDAALARMCEHYGVQQTSETSDISESEIGVPEYSDVSDVSDVVRGRLAGASDL